MYYPKKMGGKIMEYEKIKQLMEDMSNSKLTELEVEFPEGLKISMKKEDIKVNTVKNSSTENIINIPINQESNLGIKNFENVKTIKSPMVGTFYLKPSPDSNPYVEIGKEIKQGEILCIIEAMKLMNEIESEYSGKIKEILVKDGEPVEYGTELFIIE